MSQLLNLIRNVKSHYVTETFTRRKNENCAASDIDFSTTTFKKFLWTYIKKRVDLHQIGRQERHRGAKNPVLLFFNSGQDI